MGGHPDELLVQAGGVAIIMGLGAAGTGGGGGADSQGASRSLHRTVVAAMRKHTASSPLQRDGCGAISNLAQTPAARPDLLTAGAHTAVSTHGAGGVFDPRR
jgi:hypothetical protein